MVIDKRKSGERERERERDMIYATTASWVTKLLLLQS